MIVGWCDANVDTRALQAKRVEFTFGRGSIPSGSSLFPAGQSASGEHGSRTRNCSTNMSHWIGFGY